MELTSGWVTAVASLLTVLSGFAAWVVKRRSEAKDPIPKAAAELAVAEQALGLIRESRDALRDDVVRLKAERIEDRLRLDECQKQVDQLRVDNQGLHADLSQIRQVLSAATRYIEVLLRWVREGSHPPQPQLPAVLHELVDPTLLQ